MPLVAAALTAFAALLLGQAIAQRRFVPWDSWAALQQLNYYLFLPALFFSSLSTIDLVNLRLLAPGLAVAATMLVGSLLVALWRWRPGVNQALTPALLEAALRANMPLGFGLAYILFKGQVGLQFMALAGLFYLPSVILIGAYISQGCTGVDRGRFSRLGFLTQAGRLFRRNPILIAALLGLAFNATGLRLHPALAALLLIFGAAAIPLGILAAGAAMNTRTLRQVMGAQPREIAVVTLLKLVALPVVAGALAWALGLQGITAKAVVLLAALPCVAPRFSVAAPPGSAPPVLNAAATATTLLWVVTLPLALWILT